MTSPVAIMLNSSSPTFGQAGVSPEEVHREVERICAHPLFSNAPMLRRFLRFTIEKTLAGQLDAVKEYTIGSEGLGRGTSFDPARSSIVRTQAFNLRQRLNALYEEQGTPNSFRIVFEPGSYVPAVERAQP